MNGIHPERRASRLCEAWIDSVMSIKGFATTDQFLEWMLTEEGRKAEAEFLKRSGLKEIR